MENTITCTKVNIGKAYTDSFHLFCTDEEEYISALNALGRIDKPRSSK